jgi:TPR repeat
MSNLRSASKLTSRSIFPKLADPVMLAYLLTAVAAAQSPQQYSLKVNGLPVSAIRPATRIAGEWYVPLAPLARALGADLKVDATAQSLRVLRSDGVTTSYDATTGRILQGSLVLAQIKNFRLVQLNVGIENLFFPLDAVIALLGVNARENTEQAVLEIDSLPPAATGAPGSHSVQLASLDELYTFFTNGPTWQQAFDMRGQALAGSSSLTANLELNRVVGGPFFDFRQGTARFETASHRAITAGDQGTSGDLDALSNSVRGLGYEWRWNRYVFDVYGGRAASTVSSSVGSVGLANYDTTLAGFRIHGKYGKSDLSVGANTFRGERRRGITFGVGYKGNYARNDFRVQGLLGSFSGFSLRPVLKLVESSLLTQSQGQEVGNLPSVADSRTSIIESTEETARVKGSAYGFSILDSFAPFKSTLLLFTGLWEQYSKNFLVVRDEAQFSAVSRKSLSTGFRPSRYFGFTGSVRRSTALLGNPALDRGFAYGANAITPGRVPVQFSYFRSVQTLGARFAMTQYSLNLPHVSRYSASSVYSEFRFGDTLTRSITNTVSADFKRLGQLGVHDQLQFGYGHNYGVDWARQFKRTGIYFAGGLERQSILGQRSITAPVGALRVPLPRGQHFAVSYFSLRGSKLLRFEIGGPIFRPRELVSSVTQTGVIVPVSISGQVYYDVDSDERFKAGVDRPLDHLQVWLDGQESTTTDAGGYFRFDGLPPGPHHLRVVITNLPADLVVVRDEVIMGAIPYARNREDFRAVRVGRITGVLRLATMNESGETVETPFPDARIVATGNRETFSEREGDFVLADLPPGSYQLSVDTATIPRGFVATPKVRTVQVKSGQSTEGVDFVLARPVIVKPAPPNRPAGATPPVPQANGAAPKGVIHGKLVGPAAVPLDKIEIRLAPGDRSMRPDGEGNFYFDDLSAGEHKISVDEKTLPEYAILAEPASVTVNVVAGREHPVVMLRVENREVVPPVRGRVASEAVGDPERFPWAAPPQTAVDTTVAALPEPLVIVTASSPVRPAQPRGPDSAQKHNLDGRRLTQAGRYQEAIAELNEAIRLRPDFALAYNARGYAWYLLRNYAAANDDLSRAIQLNPDYLNAYQLRAVARRALGDTMGAAADAQRAKELAR